MATASLIRNRKRFLKEIMSNDPNERIVGGQADGVAMIVDRYADFCQGAQGTEKKSLPKKNRMSLFPTTKRVAVYAAKGGLKKDLYAEIPLAYLKEISFEAVHKDDRILCVTEFIADDAAPCPSIVFNMSTAQYDDLTGYYSTLKSLADMCARWVRFTDATDYATFQKVEAERRSPERDRKDAEKRRRKDGKAKSADAGSGGEAAQPSRQMRQPSRSMPSNRQQRQQPYHGQSQQTRQQQAPYATRPPYPVQPPQGGQAMRTPYRQQPPMQRQNGNGGMPYVR